ncbi:beta-glucuronosyltransferase GlcAT14A-like [Aristolochia californica]|uniref:beta-glucuronosyltransferase GlcAT14A-like n=1 Tax=Aristolochia californica TaxID=171875 RepID=UPI0035D5EE3D
MKAPKSLMGIKEFAISFIVASFLFFLLFVPALLTGPAAGIDSPKVVSVPQYGDFPVTFAYLISASRGDINKLKRTLRALYHPGNYYLLHLDLEASPNERLQLTNFIAEDPIFNQMGNVWIVEKSNLVTYRGPTMLANTLHAMALLLRTCKWDWFINLSASDYPLVTQDDLIHAFSDLPRDLNFVGYTSHLGWKLNKRAKPIMIDPALYTTEKSEILWIPEQRALPSAFKLYTGSAWMALSRSFAEYCVVGWENLPRTLLLYYTNFVSSPEGYFQTVICNSKDFKNTTISHDLHYISWDNPPKQHPRSLGLRDFKRFIFSNAAFARKFKEGDRVLNKIDREVLHRYNDRFSHGGWCSERGKRTETCSGLGRGQGAGVLRPGAGSRRLKALFNKLISNKNFRKKQCR